MNATNRIEVTRPRPTLDQKLTILSFALFLMQDPVVKSFEFATGSIDALDADILAICLIYSPLALALSIRILRGYTLRVAPFVIIYIGLAFAFALTLAIHPSYESIMFDSEWSYNIVDSVFSPLNAVWSVLFLVQLRSPDLIFKALHLFALANTLYGLIRFAQYMNRGYWTTYASTGAEIHSGYSLSFGYDMMLSALILAAMAFRGSRPWFHGVLAALSIALILIAGSRASLAIGVLGIGVLALYHGRRWILRNRLAPAIITFATALLAFCALRFDLVIRWTDDMLTSLGLSSRSMDAILAGDFGDDNGRDNIHQLANDLISEAPLLGHGMYGDRAAIRDFYFWGYPHSILLELQVTFGAIFGLLILVALIMWVAYAFFTSPRDGSRDLIVLFAIQTPQLVVSNSYLYVLAFWATIATSYLAISRRRELRQIDQITTRSSSDQHVQETKETIPTD